MKKYIIFMVVGFTLGLLQASPKKSGTPTTNNLKIKNAQKSCIEDKKQEKLAFSINVFDAEKGTFKKILFTKPDIEDVISSLKKMSEDQINKLFDFYSWYCMHVDYKQRTCSQTALADWQKRLKHYLWVQRINWPLDTRRDFSIRIFYQLLDAVCQYDADRGCYKSLKSSKS